MGEDHQRSRPPTFVQIDEPLIDRVRKFNQDSARNWWSHATANQRLYTTNVAQYRSMYFFIVHIPGLRREVSSNSSKQMQETRAERELQSPSKLIFYSVNRRRARIHSFR